MPTFRNIPQMTRANYHINVGWKYLEEWLEREEINMNPDFQRHYVWTQKQKEQYVEWILRGGSSGKDIYFNHPGWMTSFEGEMVIVDGKQRIEAVVGFLHDKVKAYYYYLSEYEDKLDTITHGFDVYVNDLKDRHEVLKWYLDMNTGGTVHTDNEIEKVRELIEKENK